MNRNNGIRKRIRNSFRNSLRSVLLPGLVLLLSLPARTEAFADVIWIEEETEPFYLEHEEACSSDGHSYLITENVGNLQIMAEPGGTKVLETVPAGETIEVKYRYTDPAGKEWGYAENRGWFSMEGLYRVFDADLFQEQHADELFREDPGITETLKEGDLIRGFSYPAGPRTEDVQVIGSEIPGSGLYYRDPAGLLWQYVGYYYGIRDFWYCMDDPAAELEELYPDGVPDLDQRNRKDGSEEKTLTQKSSGPGEADPEEKDPEETGMTGPAALSAEKEPAEAESPAQPVAKGTEAASQQTSEEAETALQSAAKETEETSPQPEQVEMSAEPEETETGLSVPAQAVLLSGGAILIAAILLFFLKKKSGD